MKETGLEPEVKETGIRPIVIEEIRNFARKNGIKKVVLFGSRARGDYWRASDIDLAVWGGDIQTFANYVSNLAVLCKAGEEDLSNEFIGIL